MPTSTIYECCAIVEGNPVLKWKSLAGNHFDYYIITRASDLEQYKEIKPKEKIRVRLYKDRVIASCSKYIFVQYDEPYTEVEIEMEIP